MMSDAPDLYIAPSSRPLFYSLASALREGRPAEIVYLDDYAPIPASVLARLRRDYPQFQISRRRDGDCITEFATLPRWLPGVLRRNIASHPGHWLARPADHPPGWLGPAYRNAYIYMTGPFITKALRHRCQRIILREDGMGNYHPIRVGPGKALLRGLFGLPPFYRNMGEEPWVSRIELERPDDLPASLRGKAASLRLEEMMDDLGPSRSQALAQAFWEDGASDAKTVLSSGTRRRALILTQPLARMGFATTVEADAIYAGIARRLTAAGYEVLIKRHPQEGGTPEGKGQIPAFFPIEAWPWIQPDRFALGVAMCSAALDSAGGLFSERQLQLVPPARFGRGRLGGWENALDEALLNPD